MPDHNKHDNGSMVSHIQSRIRNRTALMLLTVGLLASLLVHAAFYLLLAITHPPAAAPLSTALPTSDWTAAYSAYTAAVQDWQSTITLYEQAFGLSLLAAIGFVIGIGMLVAPRWASLWSFCSLNLCFAWSSNLLGDISTNPNVGAGFVLLSQADLLWSLGNLGYFIPPTTHELSGQQFVVQIPEFIVIDLEALALLGILAGSIFLLNRGKGVATAILRSLQIVTLTLTILGTEIALFDSREFYLHVVQAQSFLDFVPSFTNADLLFLSLAMLVASTALLNVRRLRHPRTASPVSHLGS